MIRSELSAIAPDYHGAIDFAELEQWGLHPDQVIDFSVNSNPFGPVAGVDEALRTVPPERYPDKECLALRTKLSEHRDIASHRILVGNGVAELLWLVAFACLRANDRVLVLGPTFGEYKRNAKLMGAEVFTWQAKSEQDFAVQVNEVERLLRQHQPKLVHLCNPNNPTGQIVPQAVIARWAESFPQTLFVIDEAYISFTPRMDSAILLGADNILVLRSMTKDYALAGLRLGYALGSAELIAGLTKVRIPWSVNSLAQAAGLAVLAAQAEYETMWVRLRQVSQTFRQGLSDLGYQPVPSHTHYFLLDVGHGATFRERLLPHGILVRLCESYQLPRFVRLAARTPNENDTLLTTLATMKTHVKDTP